MATVEEELELLETEIAGLPDVAQSVDRVIDDLLARVEAAGPDPERLAALVTSIRANKDSIIASVLKGTVAEPSPVEEPPPPEEPPAEG